MLQCGLSKYILFMYFFIRLHILLIYTDTRRLANSWIYVSILGVFNTVASCFKVKLNFIV